MSHEFHFLDDVATADLAFDAVGDSLQELFQGATCALIEVLADPITVGSTWRQTIERTDEDPAELLFDWLSDLVYWKDAAGIVFSKAPVISGYAAEAGCAARGSTERAEGVGARANHEPRGGW